jgi:hypothetical protein
MSRKEENTGFICQNCRRAVFAMDNGGYRNHCPFCLFSRHVDKASGDRREACGGLMKPVGIRYKPGKGYQIIHRCLKCGVEKVNKAVVDTIQPDDSLVIHHYFSSTTTSPVSRNRARGARYGNQKDTNGGYFQQLIK